MTRSPRARLSAVDIVRGAAVVLMALDHTRDYTTSLRFSPEDFSQSSLAIFATRRVTHFCAPAFALMAGVGIGLMAIRGTPPREIRRLLVTRSLWLLVLEARHHAGGLAVRVRAAACLRARAMGARLVDDCDGGRHRAATGGGSPRCRSRSLRGTTWPTASRRPRSGRLRRSGTSCTCPASCGRAESSSPIRSCPGWPWWRSATCWRRSTKWDEARRRRLLLGAGLAAVVVFVVLRGMNGYGNPAPWRPQATPALTVASFFNLLKYRPSLQFLLMTLGPALVALALAERARGWVARALAVYGRVPMFFYVAHIFVVHALAVVIAFVQSDEVRRIQAVTWLRPSICRAGRSGG